MEKTGKKVFFEALVLKRAKAVESAFRHMAEVQRLNAEDISSKLKLSPPTVHKYARLLSVDMVKKAHPEKNYKKAAWLPIVRRLRAKGNNWDTIGKALGCSRITANRFGMQHGLNTYNPRRASTGDIF